MYMRIYIYIYISLSLSVLQQELFQYVQSLLQVVLVNEALDEHGICNDVWDNTWAQGSNISILQADKPASSACQ